MNRFQHRLRLLIVAGSAAGFLGSWGLLAHAGKPVAETSDPAPAAAPVQVIPSKLPPLDFKSMESTSGSRSLQPLPVLPSMPSFGFPRLRSGGS